MKRPDVSALTQALGHEFTGTAVLEQALTHPSAGSPARPDNQRLEFLGDRVLGLVIAEMLMEAFPGLAEGDLAPRFNQLVRRETLADVAVEIGIGHHLMLGRSENISGGRRKAAILADAMEAVIAAVYLDGGLAAAKTLVSTHWAARIRAVRKAPVDAKTRLQEWAQGRGLALPEYAILERSGPDHAPVFKVEARLETGAHAVGEARSKRQAEQLAASELYEKVNHD